MITDRIFDGKEYRDMTPKEIADREAKAYEAERQYWLNISYDEAVNAEIRKRYTESQEFAILRQANAKPEEYEIYYNYCEECKTYVKAKQKGVLE
jgi:methionyl-tRNA synthetase